MTTILGVFVVLAVATTGLVNCFPGGLGRQKDADSTVQGIVDSVRRDVEIHAMQQFPRYDAVAYRMQVVSGYMYYVKVRVGSMEYIHVKVWKKPNGTTKYRDVLTGQTSWGDIDAF